MFAFLENLQIEGVAQKGVSQNINRALWPNNAINLQDDYVLIGSCNSPYCKSYAAKTTWNFTKQGIMHPSIVKSTRMRCRCTCNNARTFSNRCCYKCGKVDKAQSNKSVPILIGSSIRSNSSKSVEEPVLFEKGKCEKSIAATTHEPHHHDIESIDISNLGINTQTTSNHAHNHTHKNGNKLEGELYANGKGRSRQHSEPNSIVTSASSNVHRYQRRWSSSSSFYMWKKKSTLKESSTADGNSRRKEAVVVRNIVNELENISERTANELSVTRELLPHSTTDSDNGTPFPLLQLPNELIFMILSNLHVRDLKTCKTVCRRLYHIVNETVKGNVNIYVILT